MEKAATLATAYGTVISYKAHTFEGKGEPSKRKLGFTMLWPGSAVARQRGFMRLLATAFEISEPGTAFMGFSGEVAGLGGRTLNMGFKGLWRPRWVTHRG